MSRKTECQKARLKIFGLKQILSCPQFMLIQSKFTTPSRSFLIKFQKSEMIGSIFFEQSFGECLIKPDLHKVLTWRSSYIRFVTGQIIELVKLRLLICFPTFSRTNPAILKPCAELGKASFLSVFVQKIEIRAIIALISAFFRKEHQVKLLIGNTIGHRQLQF